MRKIKLVVPGMILLLLSCGLSKIAQAHDDSHVVTYTINEISEIAITGAPHLDIIAPAAGNQPAADTDATCTYALTINGANKKITGVINTDMHEDTTLSIELVAPSGHAEAAALLSTVAAELTDAMSPIADASSGITYVLNATVDADPVIDEVRTVTLTVSTD